MPSPISVARIENIYFSYSSQEPLLNGLCFSLSSGQKVALCGPNGSGKSTLIQILEGKLSDHDGNFSVVEAAEFVSQEASLIYPELSGGQARLKVALEALDKGPDLIVLDEPTNDLDPDNKKLLLSSIFSSPLAALIVSHDPDVLDQVDEIWELRSGKIQKHPAGFEAMIQRIESEELRLKRQIQNIESQKRRRTQHARLVAERQEKRKERGIKDGIKQNLPKVKRGEKKRQAQKTLARLSKTHNESVSEQSQRLLTAQKRLRQLSTFEWDMALTRPPRGKRMIHIANLRMPGINEMQLDFSAFGPKRIHLRGPNGSGKSTLLQALAGNAFALSRVRGSLEAAKPLQLFDQRLGQFSSPEMLWRYFHKKNPHFTVAQATQILGRLGFEQEQQKRPVHGLSGGEKTRLELATMLATHEPPQLLLLDEPTNHLDLESRKILLDFLKSFEGCILLVSHDQRFVSELNFDTTLDLGHL